MDWRRGPLQVRRLVACEATLFRVSPAKAVSVAGCESGFNRRASNGGRYVGVFQHAASAWYGRWQTYARDYFRPWYNARTNTVVAMRMARQMGWSAWGCA
jgi:hypothetical protein